MKAIRWIPVLLAPFAGCGDNSQSLECGPGTYEEAGECVADPVDPSSPASRRSCLDAFADRVGDGIAVDAAAEAGGDGSLEQPFRSIQEGVDAAAEGQTIGIAAGEYEEDVTLDKAVALEGLCAQESILTGSIVVDGIAGAAIRGLTVREGTPGILAQGVPDASGGGFGLEIRYVIATENQGAGIEIDSSSVRILDSEFTQTREVGTDLRQLGSGIFVANGSRFEVGLSIINMNGFIGVDVADAEGAPSARGGVQFATPTEPSTGIINMNGIIGNPGGGVRVNAESTALPVVGGPELRLLGNAFEMNGGTTVFAQTANVSIAGNAFVGGADSETAMRLNESSGLISNNEVESFTKFGLVLDTSSFVSVVGNEVHDNTGVGIFARNSDEVSIHNNVVEGTSVATGSTRGGDGIVLAGLGADFSGHHSLQGNRVRRNERSGVIVDGLGQEDDATVYYELRNNEIRESGSIGINIYAAYTGVMEANTLVDNALYGLRCLESPGSSSRVFFDGNMVMSTRKSSDMRGGDAVMMSNCHVSVDDNTVSGSANYGLFFEEDSDGGCDRNMITDSMWEDILVQGSPGMGLADNLGTIEILPDNEKDSDTTRSPLADLANPVPQG